MPEMTLPRARDPALLKNENLIYPVLAFLLIFFVCPILWFFVKSALDYDGNFALMLLHTFSSPLFIKVVLKTVWISLLVTVLALLAAYPIAYTLSRSSALSFTLIMICVIVPYFTSIIVRTYSWMVILGTHGVINRFLIFAGLIDKPIALLYNMVGVVIGMTYVLLPYFVLTLYAAMKGIDPWLMQAGRGMGASNFHVFRKVFLPLSMPGVVSGFFDRVYPGHRILHHTGADGRPRGRDDGDADTAQHRNHHELAIGIGAIAVPAGHHPGDLRGVLPIYRYE